MTTEKSTEKPSIHIKKYANRRLYHTGTSTYVTQDDLAVMVRKGEDFIVTDAKTGEDITRSVLAQIIFEQETRGDGQTMLPATFLRQLIRFYGDSIQSLVPGYLEFSMDHLTREQKTLREQMAQAFNPAKFLSFEEQMKANTALFAQAMKLFNPFALKREEAKNTGSEEVAELKRQISDLQARLDEALKKN